MPELSLTVLRAGLGEPAVTPQIEIVLEARASRPVAGATLTLLVRIEPRLRSYQDAERERLIPLLGRPELGPRALADLLWARTTIVTGAFEGSLELSVALPCTADVEQVLGKLLAALEGGEIPIAIAARGQVFVQGAQGLELVPVHHAQEASFRVPVTLLRDALERAYGERRALSVSAGTFERLARYRLAAGLGSDDAALARLLAEHAS